MTESYLVVGGSSDIAQLLVTQLLEQGKQVTVLARDSSRVEHFSNSGVSVIIGDALDSSVLQSAIETAKENGNGSIAGAAHLVGSILVKPPHALKLDDFEEVIRTNLTSAFLSLSLICKAMLRSGGGRLVFTSSVAGSLGLVNHEAIAAAKGGIESMVRSAAATYAQRNIRVNAVAPGLTETRLGSTFLRSDAIREAAVSMIPMKRINQPEEVATSIRWLLTEAPDNFTGQALNLDGGMANVRN